MQLRSSRVPRATLRQSVIIAKYGRPTSAGLWAAHGRYAEREAATGGNPLYAGFNAEGEISLPQTLGAWQKHAEQKHIKRRKHQPVMFRFIISPADGDQIDLVEHTRAIVAYLETRLGHKVEWGAAIHTNTGQPHAHLYIYNQTDRQSFRIPKEIISNDLRQYSRHLITKQLGPERPYQRLRREARNLHQPRPTLTDRSLLNAADDNNVVKLKPPQSNPTSVTRHAHRISRLRWLQQHGLAERLTSDTWKLVDDLPAQLRKLHQLHAMSERSRLPVSGQVRIPRGKTQLYRLADITYDETTSRTALILERDGNYYFHLESDRQRERRRELGILPGMDLALRATAFHNRRDGSLVDYIDVLPLHNDHHCAIADRAANANTERECRKWWKRLRDELQPPIPETVLNVAYRTKVQERSR
ncbi:MAG: hypothetical protein D6761_05215 [Candidatus Dadabacteria bacterium]|nr:MAG: hypothetical protein D6761_05215 [Candidatus Dadabacteria bacterium]